MSRTPWGVEEKTAWRKQQTVKRSYATDVVTIINAFKAAPPLPGFEVVQYGALSLDPERYPVFVIRTATFDSKKPTVLVTGGVHGYETSGVHGALRFVESDDGMAMYSDKFNFVVAPCLSPWGYETINRWNAFAVDPNRNFKWQQDGPAEECLLLMEYLKTLDMLESTTVHIDLHETTDTDNTVFRPALAARDGLALNTDNEEIPDGFYLCGDLARQELAFQKAVIDKVRGVTHIAPPDTNNQIIGTDVTQEGVILYPVKKLGLCIGMTAARLCTTTEVYPDSPSCTSDECNRAQVAAITGGLDYVLLEHS